LASGFHQYAAGHARLTRSTQFPLGVPDNWDAERQALSAPAKSSLGNELWLVREKTFQVVLAEGVAMYAENIHGLARLPASCAGTRRRTPSGSQPAPRSRPALQRRVLKLDSFSVLVKASANCRRQLWLAAEQTLLP